MKPLIEGFPELKPSTPIPNKSPYLTALGCILWYKSWAAHQPPVALSKSLGKDLFKFGLSLGVTAVSLAMEGRVDGRCFLEY